MILTLINYAPEGRRGDLLHYIKFWSLESDFSYLKIIQLLTGETNVLKQDTKSFFVKCLKSSIIFSFKLGGALQNWEFKIASNANFKKHHH